MQRARKKQQSAPLLRRKRATGGALCSAEAFWSIVAVFLFLSLAVASIAYEFFSNGASLSSSTPPAGKEHSRGGSHREALASSDGGTTPPHLFPKFPVLPIFAPVPDAERLMEDTINGTPTMAGIVAILQRFISEFHKANRLLVASKASSMEIVNKYFALTDQYLGPFEQAYRDKPIFPIRQDDSIFLSLAAFREHLLADTLVFAFKHAKNPEKLFVGAVVQNCFGRVLEDGSIDASGLPCKTGAEVVGKNKQGRDMTKVSDAPIDKNGIEDFCAMEEYKKYCENGQIRALYIHETESVGPAVARYHASKLWGGETYFMQCDSHLMFADNWDAKYVAEVRATQNYPKSVLSSYPPGFNGVDDKTNMVRETTGTRLCFCETRVEDPNPIVRINSGMSYRGDEPRPTQIPFIAAGFFFAGSTFLVDVPFDPYMPWLFMGEEMALSMRAWTHGWDIYAPRKNLIAHQYRPGRMGLPKFWGSVNRFYGRGIGNNQLQGKVIKRTKHMVGYPDSSLERIKKEGIEIVLTDVEQYSLGKERSWDDYMEHASMHVNVEHDVIDCTRNKWCNQGLKD